MLVDLSHTIEHGMETYPGLPGPEIDEHLTREASRAHYDQGTEFSIGRIAMVGNTGTYLDTPAHRYAHGHDLAGLPLERCADLPGVVVDVAAEGPVGAEAFDGLELAGRAALVRSGWDQHWRTARYGDPSHPHLTAEATQALVDAGVALVGIDSVNIDETAGGRRPAHSGLLAADIPIVEHLTNLAALGSAAFRFFAVPAKVAGLGTWPVRAFAIVER